MKTKFKVLFLSGILLLSSSYNANAQEDSPHRGGFLKNWAVGVDAGLYGYGGYVATSLLPNLKARIGFEYLGYTLKDAIEFDADAIYVDPQGNTHDFEQSITGELTDTKLKFPNFKALFDFYPVKDGIFSLTAGFYVGNNDIKTNGMINDYASYPEHPDFEFEDIIISPNADGSFNARIKMGNTFKPYFGIGLGRTISKSRVGFRFDLGVVYQGEYKIESDNVIQGIDTLNDKAADFDLPFSKDLLKLWPMINFSLSYRIK